MLVSSNQKKRFSANRFFIKKEKLTNTNVIDFERENFTLRTFFHLYGISQLTIYKLYTSLFVQISLQPSCLYFVVYSLSQIVHRRGVYDKRTKRL